MSADGCLIDAPLILTKEEYKVKVLFAKEGLLPQLQQLHDQDHFSLPYELMLKEEINEKDDSNMIAFYFGDLLTHIPLFIRAKWQKYFLGIETETDTALRTLHDNSLHRLRKFTYVYRGAIFLRIAWEL